MSFGWRSRQRKKASRSDPRMKQIEALAMSTGGHLDRRSGAAAPGWPGVLLGGARGCGGGLAHHASHGALNDFPVVAQFMPRDGRRGAVIHGLRSLQQSVGLSGGAVLSGSQSIRQVPYRVTDTLTNARLAFRKTISCRGDRKNWAVGL